MTTMFGGAAQAIDAAPALPPAYSLLGVTGALGIPEADWLAGAKWLPELTRTTGGLSSGAVAIDCIGDTDTGMTAEDAPAQKTGYPYAVWSSFRCSATGWQAAGYAGRARRLLDAVQSFYVARELWSGAINTSAGLGNGVLNAANPTTDTLSTAAVAVDVAFALVEQGIAFYGRGRRGMIHCTPQVLFAIQLNGGVQRVNGLWTTPMGNVVVADAGYDGSGPGNSAPTSAHQWIYGTEILDVMLSPVTSLPNADLDEDPAAFMKEALDRTVDKVTVYAFRAAAVRWDQQIHVAAQVNIGIPAYA